jgi:SAM-dependent methyltransferase
LNREEYQKMYALEENNWWFVGRRTILAALLNQITGTPARILDAGCGTGMNLGLLQPYGEVTGLDISPLALDGCRRRGFNRVVLGNVEELPFGQDAFDLVTALDLLEHVAAPKALAEIYRVLKPGGYAVINVPAYQFLWSGHDRALGHRQRYVAIKMKRLLKGQGFRVLKISYWNTFLFPFIAGIRLIKSWTRGKTGPETDNYGFGPVVNGWLTSLLQTEAKIIRHVNLPFGVSLVCVAQKCG